MNQFMACVLICICISLSACAGGMNDKGQKSSVNEVIWQTGLDTEKFWRDYAKSKGGLTWGQSSQYPEYAKVKEGDTFMVEVAQGICLMEFFHNRWRRANDVRRWDDSINEYSGCPNVFD